MKKDQITQEEEAEVMQDDLTAAHIKLINKKKKNTALKSELQKIKDENAAMSSTIDIHEERSSELHEALDNTQANVD